MICPYCFEQGEAVRELVKQDTHYHCEACGTTVSLDVSARARQIARLQGY